MPGRNDVYNLNHESPAMHQVRMGDKLKQLITLGNQLRTAAVDENKVVAGMPGVGYGITAPAKIRMTGPIRYQIGGQFYESADVALAEKTKQIIEIAADLKTLINAVRTQELTRCVTPPNFEIVSNFDIQNGDPLEIISGGVLKTIATDQLFDTGTSTVIATSAYWAAGILSIDIGGTTHVDWGAEAVDEAGAITNLAAVTAAGEVVCGYVTVHAAAGQDWVAGTDALTTGTGGEVAQATNYYNNQYVGDAVMGAAVSTSVDDITTAPEAVLDSAGQDITAAKFGAWRIQISKIGVLTTTAAHDTIDMAYESAELALLAVANQAKVANTVIVGYLVIEAAGGGFTIGTDLPKTSDAQVTAATYYDVVGDSGLIAAATGEVSATAEKLKIGASTVKINGIELAEIGADAVLAFPLADTITGLKWGAWLILSDLAGTAHYVQSVDGDMTASLMAYDDYAAAKAAADALILNMPNRFVVLGVLYVHNDADLFTAITHALTDGTDIVESVFNMRIVNEGLQVIDADAVDDITGEVGE